MTVADAGSSPLPRAVKAVVAVLSARPEVSAIAIGGSRAAGTADPASDIDVYAFCDAAVPQAPRRALAERFDPAPEIGHSWFGETDEWADSRDGTAIDLMFWDRLPFEEQLRGVIERHRPSLGYSTAFWFTIRNATPLYDRDGWLDRMQRLASGPCPEELRRAIVAWNYPLLRTTRSSYRHQVELAVLRRDPVSVQHRITAFLASALDIVFAANRALHPGEKRLLDHIAALGDGVPAGLVGHIRELLRHGDVMSAMDAVCDDIDALLRRHDLEIPGAD